jgi:hypothetical protein
MGEPGDGAEVHQVGYLRRLDEALQGAVVVDEMDAIQRKYHEFNMNYLTYSGVLSNLCPIYSCRQCLVDLR